MTQRKVNLRRNVNSEERTFWEEKKFRAEPPEIIFERLIFSPSSYMTENHFGRVDVDVPQPSK